MHAPRPHFRLIRHAVFGLAAVAIGLTMLGCGDGNGGASLIDTVSAELHGQSGVDAPIEAEADAVLVEGQPTWCDAGHDLDTIHRAFHEGGDVLPSAAEMQQAVEAAQVIESMADDAILSADASTVAHGLTITAEAGSASIFQEEPYLSAATNVFDTIEGRCPA